MRLFLSIPLPAEVLELAVQTQNDLKALITRQGVRFTAPSKMHLTLCFLGDDRQPEEVDPLAAQILAGVGRMNLTTGGLGAFPDTHRPKNIGLAVTGDGLQAAADALIEAFDIEPTEFAGHITLARISPPSKAVGYVMAPHLTRELEAVVEWHASEVHLLTPLATGEYEALRRYILGQSQPT